MEQRALVGVAGSGALLFGILIGLAIAPIMTNQNLDAGWSSLVGGALGAGITVLGTMYVAKSNSASAARLRRLLLGEAITAIRDEAYVLVALTDETEIDDVADHGAQLMGQLGLLKEALSVYELVKEDGTVTDYKMRLSLFRLDDQVRKNMAILEKEERWLGRPSRAVIENSRADLSFASTMIFQACVLALGELSITYALPRDEEVEAQLERLLPTGDPE